MLYDKKCFSINLSKKRNKKVENKQWKKSRKWEKEKNDAKGKQNKRIKEIYQGN